MSIAKQFFNHAPWYTPVCDCCGSELPSVQDFSEAVTAKKEAGWRSRKDTDGSWQDQCPDCQINEATMPLLEGVFR